MASDLAAERQSHRGAQARAEPRAFRRGEPRQQFVAPRRRTEQAHVGRLAPRQDAERREVVLGEVGHHDGGIQWFVRDAGERLGRPATQDAVCIRGAAGREETVR